MHGVHTKVLPFSLFFPLSFPPPSPSIFTKKGGGGKKGERSGGGGEEWRRIGSGERPVSHHLEVSPCVNKSEEGFK